jgi:hypothetical protein
MPEGDSTGLPEGLERSRDKHPERRVWTRLLGLALLLAFVVAALLNEFGQAAMTSTASAPEATLQVTAPNRLRGGLLFEGKFEVTAAKTLKAPTLILDDGWLNAMTLNTLEPAPTSERSVHGRLHLTFGRLDAGRSLTVWTQWQVNPTNVGSASQDVTLADGGSRLASVDRTVTTFP